MKTTIKSFLVAAVAATTLFSCAKEIESPEGAVPGNPGDVQISIGLGGGATTYATSAIEKTIHGGNAVLFDSLTGSPIPMTGITVTGNKFTATVPAAGFKSGETKAKLVIYVNGDITPAAPATLAEMKAATIAQDLDLALAKGIPAVVETPYVILTGGVTFRDPYKLLRVASRVGAKTTGTYSDYTVTLNNVNLTSGKLFPLASDVHNTPSAGTVGHKLNGTLTDMFNDSEAVGYVYPSAEADIVVTPIAGKGEPKTVKFTPKANMNYTVIITPMVNSDGSFDNAISIKEWETNEDINVDLNPNKVLAEVAITGTSQTNFTKYLDGVSVKAGFTSERLDIQTLVKEPAGVLGVLRLDVVTTFAVADTPTAENPLTLATAGQSTVFGIAALANYAGADVKKTIKVTYMPETEGAKNIERYLNIYLTKAESSLEKVLVNIGGNLWMPFNTSGVAATDEATAAAILATNGATIAEKTANYAYASVANFKKIQGIYKKAVNGITTCPAGYKNANLAAWEALAGNATMPQNAGTHWCAAGVAQEFQNSILSRVTKTGIVGGNTDAKKMNFYTIFTAKAQLGATAGDVLPFIGNGWANGEGLTPGVEILGGMVVWGGDLLNGKYTRMAVWNDGVYYHYTPNPATDIANVRCIKIK